MRAVVMRNRQLMVADVPTPEPGPGEVLVRTLACGICGSDLHAFRHAERFVEAGRRAGNARVMDLARDVVMGHEFCAEIVDHGPGTTRALRIGTRVCSRPTLLRATGPQSIGYSNDNPGGYGEYMRLTEALLLEVPADLSTEHAAFTEPMAVGVHAVARARLEPDDAPLVIGCGPVGLAVIAALRLRGVRPIVAADFSPLRRRARGGPRRRRRRRSRRARPLAELARGGGVARCQPRAPASALGARAAASARRGLRVRRGPRRPRPDHGGGAARHPHRGGRRVHGAGHDLPLARHRQGAERAVRPRLHAGRVRGHPRGTSPRAPSRSLPCSRAGSASGAWPARSRTSPPPIATRRSSSSRGATRPEACRTGPRRAAGTVASGRGRARRRRVPGPMQRSAHAWPGRPATRPGRRGSGQTRATSRA